MTTTSGMDWWKRQRELLANEPGLKRGDPLVCDACGATVPNDGMISQLMAVWEFDDERGSHYHDHNQKRNIWICPCGWRKEHKFYIPCPVDGCDGRR